MFRLSPEIVRLSEQWAFGGELLFCESHESNWRHAHVALNGDTLTVRVEDEPLRERCVRFCLVSDQSFDNSENRFGLTLKLEHSKGPSDRMHFLCQSQLERRAWKHALKTASLLHSRLDLASKDTQASALARHEFIEFLQLPLATPPARLAHRVAAWDKETMRIGIPALPSSNVSNCAQNNVCDTVRGSTQLGDFVLVSDGLQDLVEDTEEHVRMRVRILVLSWNMAAKDMFGNEAYASRKKLRNKRRQRRQRVLSNEEGTEMLHRVLSPPPSGSAMPLQQLPPHAPAAESTRQRSLTVDSADSWDHALCQPGGTRQTRLPDRLATLLPQLSLLEESVPGDYDIYTFGVQECVSDSTFDLFELRLRVLAGDVDMQGNVLWEGDIYDQAGEEIEWGTVKRLDAGDAKVFGRGDGSFISPKFTGVAVFAVGSNACKNTRCIGSCAVSAGMMEGSKGGACVAIRTYGTTLAFMSTHLSSNAMLDRRQHYAVVTERAGRHLGLDAHTRFDLPDLVDHVIWCGDVNYRIRSDLGADRALDMIAHNKLEELRNEGDELTAELQTLGGAFHNYWEPKRRPHFFPTYKKREDRGAREPEDYLSHKWVDQVYRTRYKEPWYKSGGQVRLRMPSFTDRVLVHSRPTVSSIDLDESHGYCALNDVLLGSDHTAVRAALSLSAEPAWPLPPQLMDSVLRVQLLEMKFVRLADDRARRKRVLATAPVKKVRVVFPAPYQDCDIDDGESTSVAHLWSASQLEDVSQRLVVSARASEKRRVLHLLLRASATANATVDGNDGLVGEQPKGQCAVALPMNCFRTAAVLHRCIPLTHRGLLLHQDGATWHLQVRLKVWTLEHETR
ncbi:MAG: hypothetical protein MHM6MM_003041 [Cercozoa sp. M6MM]